MLSRFREERMKRFHAVLLVAALAVGCCSALAQNKAAAPPTTVAATFDQELSHLEHGLIGLAETMPEDKYNFRPTQGKFDGVLDFGGQVKHLSGGIAMYAAGILGEKPPAEPASLKTKAELVQYLKSSLTYAHKAVASLNEQNLFTPIPAPFGKNQTTRLSLAIAMVGHPYDHYGQMVEYLRMNGVVPPGSK
jgi:DinB superfamily